MRKSKGELKNLRKLRQEILSETMYCCPECGKLCTVSEPVYEKNEIEPSAAALICSDCGNTRISQKNGSWTTESGIPYIPGAIGNSATLLYRYGDKIPETKEEFDELINLLNDVSNGYRGVFDLEGQLKTERRLNSILKEAIAKNFDYTIQLFLNLASIIQALSDLGMDKECAEEIEHGLILCHQTHELDACMFMLLMTEFEMTDSNLNEMKKIYFLLRDKDLSEIPGMDEHAFAAGRYYNMLSEIANYLNLDGEFDKLLDMTLEAYLRDVTNELDADSLSMISICYESNLTLSSRTDKEALAERYVKFTDKYRSVDDFYYYNAMMTRHLIESSKWGDMHGRDEDIDTIIKRYTICENSEERHLYANALLLRFMSDKDRMVDLEDAYDAIIENLMEGEQFDDLTCTILKLYLTTIKATDKTLYKNEVKKLNQIGISLNMINDWYNDMSSE